MVLSFVNSGNLPRNCLAGMYVPPGGVSELTQFWVLLFELPGGKFDPPGGACGIMLFLMFYCGFCDVLLFSFE